MVATMLGRIIGGIMRDQIITGLTVAGLAGNWFGLKFATFIHVGVAVAFDAASADFSGLGDFHLGGNVGASAL